MKNKMEFDDLYYALFARSSCHKEIKDLFTTDKGNWSVKLFDKYVEGQPKHLIDDLLGQFCDQKINDKFLCAIHDKHGLRTNYHQYMSIKIEISKPTFIQELYDFLKERTKITKKEFNILIKENFDITYKDSTINQYKKK